MPRVSVIIPTFNRATLLVDAIRSVLSQTYGDYEVIVVDDGSTDETAGRVQAVGGPVRYLRIPHSGRPGLVRNHAIELAQGEFIAFLDDDDLWFPEKLECQVRLLDRNRSVGFVYSDIRFLHPDGSASPPVLRGDQKQTLGLLTKLISNCYIYPSTVVARRRLLSEVGPLDEKLSTGEDYDLWLRLAHCTEAACVPHPLALIRRHPTSVSHQNQLRAYQNTIFVLERFLHDSSLPLRDRRRGRASLSRLNAHVGLLFSERGNRRQARARFLRSLQLNPLQRRAWRELLHTFSSGR